LISSRDIFSINGLTMILDIIGQRYVKHIDVRFESLDIHHHWLVSQLVPSGSLLYYIYVNFCRLDNIKNGQWFVRFIPCGHISSYQLYNNVGDNVERCINIEMMLETVSEIASTLLQR
jgi:hypothetical protein